MSDILSQDQIDELLKEFDTQKPEDIGAAEKKAEKKIRTYDFRIPKRFNKEQIKTLNIIYENYSRNLSSYLSGALRTFCQVEVMTIEEQRYFEFSNAVSENNMLGIIEMHPLEGMSLVTVSQPLVFAVIERLLGGQGSNYSISREYTEIEMALMENVIREMVALLKDAWSNVYEIVPSLVKIQGDLRQVQYVSPNETVVIILLDVKIKDVEGTLGFCMPYEILEPVLEHLNTRYWFTERKTLDGDKKQNKEILLVGISGIPMELRAVLGTSHITLEDAIELHAGDVIRLDQHIGDKTVIRSEDGDEWFSGTLGLFKNHMAVRVNEINTEGAIKNGAKFR